MRTYIKKSWARGFTLGELLITVAILGAVTAILIKGIPFLIDYCSK